VVRRLPQGIEPAPQTRRHGRQDARFAALLEIGCKLAEEVGGKVVPRRDRNVDITVPPGLILGAHEPISRRSAACLPSAATRNSSIACSRVGFPAFSHTHFETWTNGLPRR
jgi:hypothetical protein